MLRSNLEREVIEGLRLSPQQKRLWALQQRDGALPYRAQCTVRIDGSLDVAALSTAIEDVVRRQEILRTTFHYLPGMTFPLQVIDEDTQPLLKIYSLDHSGVDEQDAQIANLFAEMQQTAFNLECGPLLQASLITLSAGRNVLILGLPSLNADALALRNLVKEISLHYEALLQHQSLMGEPIQYADSSEWYNELLEAEDREEGREYWREQDLSAIRVLELPNKIRLAENIKFVPQIIATKIDSDCFEKVNRQAEKHNVSPGTFLLACWQALLWRLTNQEHVIVGSATDGREPEELKTALGLYARYLPAQCRLVESLRFTDLVEQLRRSTRENAEYQEYFNLESAGVTSESHPALVFPFCFDYDEEPACWVAGDVSFTIEQEYACMEQFHVRLSCIAAAAGLKAEFHYDSRLYDQTVITRLAAQFETLVGSVTDNNDDVTVEELEIVGAAERQQFVEWNDTAAEFPREQPINRLFETQAALTPDSVAVVHEQERISYGELNRRANQLAHHLRELGVAAEVQVALCVERSVEMIVGVLAILKAGGAYLPLDPSYPRERLRFMMADSGAAVLLTQQHLVDRLPPHDAHVVLLDAEHKEASSENPTWDVAAGNLAYVIYTSGSTGTPNGVLVTHQNLVHSTAARFAYYPTPPARFLLISSFAFDSSVAGIFWTLCSGGTLVLPVEGLQRDVQALARVVREQSVTHLLSLPSIHRLMLEVAHDGDLAGLKVVIVAGEVCPVDLVERHTALMAETNLYNEYGPTEASVWTTVAECRPAPDGRNVSIGRVIANAQLHILDDALRPEAIGVAGAIYIGGVGITRGYLRQPGLTAERFTPNPFGNEPGTRLYRTGDIGRYLEDGKIEFLGRRDSQVKIRGYRIELGEIEKILMEHSAVETAAVVARTNDGGDQQIVAYVVRGTDPAATTEELRNYLRERLPQNMVPARVVLLEKMPQMANGKIDRQALPSPELLASEGEINTPRTAIEEVLAGIWSLVLGVPELSVTANFFELGGHSLLATQVMSRVRETFNVELPVRSLFGTPTVRGLAETVEQTLLTGHSMNAPPIDRASREGKLPLSYAQQRLWFADQLTPGNTFFNVVSAVRLTGSLDQVALERTLSEIIRRHEVLRTSFPSENGKPVQMIAPSADFKLLVTDLSALNRSEGEAEAHRLALEETQKPFDLAKGPLVRASLLRLGDDEHAVILTMHHIVSDAWSKRVLIKEVAALYEAFSASDVPALAELPIQYADYALWQREWLRGEVLDRQLAYWKKQLQGAQTVLILPVDRARPAVQSFHGARYPLAFTQQTSAKLKELSQREGVTLFMTLLATFKMLLHYYSKQNDILVGANLANRNRAETEGLIGFFVNTVVLRSDLSGDPSFEELLKRVREVCLEAYAHQDLPFEKVVALLQPERNLSRQPLFQVKLELGHELFSGLKLRGLTLSPMELPTDIGRYDLQLFITETQAGLFGSWVYDKNLFDEATAARMSSQFELVLQEVVDHPNRRLGALEEVLSEWDKRHNLTRETDYKNSIHRKFKRVQKEALVAAP